MITVIQIHAKATCMKDNESVLLTQRSVHTDNVSENVTLPFLYFISVCLF